MGLIDTHAHLESFARKGQLADVLTRARAAGVDTIITVGTSPDDWVLYHEIAQVNPGVVFFTVGLHPCAVDETWSEVTKEIPRFWDRTIQASTSAHGEQATPTFPVALGECGLDRFHLPKDDLAAAERIFAWQRAAFAAQLEIAKQLDCPLVVHSRGAFRECVEMIDASSVSWAKVVFHCFTEGPEEMAELIRRGGRGSFTGVVTYKNADGVRAAAKAQGLERLMVETDAPYLTPMPHRGKPNEPALVRLTAEFCASQIFGVMAERLAAQTTANARTFFGI